MQNVTVTPPQWQFQPDQTVEHPVPEVPPAHADAGGIQWTASEFLSHQKGNNWYVILITGAFLASGLVYFLTRDWVSTITILVVAILLAVVAARPPRTLSYHLGEAALSIGQKTYPYHEFKSFSVINEGAINSIMLMPFKRFAPAVTMYYAPEDEQRILDVLSAVLPYEQREQDAVDKLMQRIRF